MELNFTEEERVKCHKVVAAFQEYFDDLGDTTVADCGKFGMLWLRWYDDGDFGAQELHDNAEELFDASKNLEDILKGKKEGNVEEGKNTLIDLFNICIYS